MTEERKAEEGDRKIAKSCTRLRSNWIKAKINENQVDSQRRLCQSKEESITHTGSEYSLMWQLR